MMEIEKINNNFILIIICRTIKKPSKNKKNHFFIYLINKLYKSTDKFDL